MFTKKVFPFLLLSLGLLCSCAKENVQPTKPVEVSLKGSGDCLSDFTGTLDRYQKGELNNGEVEVFWVCVQKAVSDYQRLTQGDLNGNYSPQAVRRFFQRYFIKTQQIKDPLLMSIMEIKRVLLSGSPQAITFDELTKLQEFLDLLKQVSLDLNPFVKVAFMHQESATDAEIHSSGAAMQNAILRLGDWLGRHGQTYSFQQMTDLIHNLNEFNQEKAEPGLFDTLEKLMAVLPPAKQILLGGQKSMVAGEEWRDLTVALGLGYRSVLGARYAFKKDLNAAMMREALPESLLFATQILEAGLKAHPDGEIPLLEWQDLFQAIEDTAWLGPEFSAEHLMMALNWSLMRALSPPGAKAQTQTAMKVAHLKVLRQVITDWSATQKSIAGDHSLHSSFGAKFEKTLSASSPHEWDAEGRMRFSFQPAQKWTKEAKLRMVWPFVIMNWLKEAYVGPRSEEMDGDQMTTAASEILSVLQGFGWLKDTKETIGLKLLREGDLFTLASNGNGKIDVAEASRYLALIASSFRAAELWRDQARLNCPDFEAVCVRSVGADLNREILSPLPRLQAWLKQKDTLKRFKNYSQAGEETILGQPVVGEFKTGDLLQVWMIFQYVETFLQRFDRDFSESVSLPESNPAFQLFRPILTKLLSGFGLPEDELFGFFTFMMKYGDTPFTMYGGQVLYNHWKWHRNDWAFESDRTELMGILNQLSKL